MAITQSTDVQIAPAFPEEQEMRNQWMKALAYYNPMLASMYSYMVPELYGQYAGVAGLQGGQALQEAQAQGQINNLLKQLNAGQDVSNQLMGLPGGQQALLQNQLLNQALQVGQGVLPTLSPDAMSQISQLGQAYETQGLAGVDRAREQAMRQWRETTAQRGLYRTDTPSQAAWAPVEAELARQTSTIGAGRGALEAQTQLQLQQQMPQMGAQLGGYGQGLQQAAQANRYQLAQQSASPYQNMFAGLGSAGTGYSPFTQQLTNLRAGAATTNTTQSGSNIPWTSALQSVGQGIGGLGQALPGIVNTAKTIPWAEIYKGISGLWA